MVGHRHPDQILDEALKFLSAGEECRAQLDELPAPIYTTDTNGRVTYWNRACVEFAGREPEIGQDRWCVTWRLFTTTGDPLRHEDCPMAQAIKQKRPVRDIIAIAERPDGKRVAFRPYPTPLFDNAGEMVGAVNMMIDVTEEQSHSLHEQAERCRRLAEATYDRSTSKVLGAMASNFEKTAGTLSKSTD
jgi:PAS domain S-box-containing protein